MIIRKKSISFGNLSTECMTSAVQSRNKPLPVKIRSVEFKEKDIDVVWEKKNSSKTGSGMVRPCFSGCK